MVLYKVLNPDRTSCYIDGVKWPAPRKRGGRWMPRVSKLEPSRRGYHLLTEATVFSFVRKGAVLFEAETGGKQICYKGQVVAETARLTRKVSWKQFAERCYLQERYYSWQWTALHVVSAAGHLELTKILSEFKWLLDLGDAEGRTALHLSTIYGRCEIAEVLLRAGAGVNERDSLGFSVLHLAVKERNARLVELFIQYGADVNALNHKDDAPSHIAVRRSAVGILSQLTNAGAIVNFRNKLGYAPLHLAVNGSHYGCERVLEQAGADPFVRMNGRLDALDLKYLNGRMPYELSRKVV